MSPLDFTSYLLSEMERLESLAPELPARKKKNDTTTQSDLFYVKDIPKDVKMSDFIWEAPIDLEAALKISKRKQLKK